MKPEEKELLLKDLCARLPYQPQVEIIKDGTSITNKLTTATINYLEDGYWDVKPYLFPLSSMTEEQKYDFYCRFIENDCDFDDFKKNYLDFGRWHKLLTSIDCIEAINDWFHKNHFDYRGLIEKGLAIDATGLDIY